MSLIAEVSTRILKGFMSTLLSDKHEKAVSPLLWDRSYCILTGMDDSAFTMEIRQSKQNLPWTMYVS